LLESHSLYNFDCSSADSVALKNGPQAIETGDWKQTSSASLNFCLSLALIINLVYSDRVRITMTEFYPMLRTRRIAPIYDRHWPCCRELKIELLLISVPD
ncbi:uncharacterized protein AKAW2_70171A, partial [Aspergillus luchuensis]